MKTIKVLRKNKIQVRMIRDASWGEEKKTHAICFQLSRSLWSNLNISSWSNYLALIYLQYYNFIFIYFFPTHMILINFKQYSLYSIVMLRICLFLYLVNLNCFDYRIHLYWSHVCFKVQYEQNESDSAERDVTRLIFCYKPNGSHVVFVF